jgi:hypothetical protein
MERHSHTRLLIKANRGSQPPCMDILSVVMTSCRLWPVEKTFPALLQFADRSLARAQGTADTRHPLRLARFLLLSRMSLATNGGARASLGKSSVGKGVGVSSPNHDISDHRARERRRQGGLCRWRVVGLLLWVTAALGGWLSAQTPDCPGRRGQADRPGQGGGAARHGRGSGARDAGASGPGRSGGATCRGRSLPPGQPGSHGLLPDDEPPSGHAHARRRLRATTRKRPRARRIRGVRGCGHSTFFPPCF